MRLPGFLSVNHRLILALLLKRWFGVDAVIYGTGQPVPEVSWDVLVIELSKPDVIWIMSLCVDIGGKFPRSYWNVFNEMLAQMP